MRPALQRLLSRPSSLNLLRALVLDAPPARPYRQSWPINLQRRECLRCQSSTASHLLLVENDFNRLSRTENDDSVTIDRNNAKDPPDALVESVSDVNINISDSDVENFLSTATSEMLEFESDLIGPHQGSRLVDRPSLRNNLPLWSHLLEFRHRRYGDEGVLMFWESMRDREFNIPVKGRLAAKFWETFINLGFKDENILQQVCSYANDLYDTTGERWPNLYSYVVRHFLLNGRGPEVISWHDRLVRRHFPDVEDYTRLIDKVVEKGDLGAFQVIYNRSDFRQAYSRIVPVLAKRGEFEAARAWHFHLMRKKDMPQQPEVIQPLIQHYTIFQPVIAKQLTASLVDLGTSFGSKVKQDVDETMQMVDDINENILIETVDLENVKNHGSKIRLYNDKLGARWFATKWIPLEVAISTVHALGVAEIGPLSLHSIALRDPTCESVRERVGQLREMGMSIGNSLFSRAVEAFAKHGKQDFLTGLLESDQHPDVLEDRKLQEDLIADFARHHQWSAYNRSIAIQALRSSSPEQDVLNNQLRESVILNDRAAINTTLDEMREKGIPVQVSSVRYLIKQMLRPRRRGLGLSKCSPFEETYQNDLDNVIAILRRIMLHNGYVPVSVWIEILRRLGMDGRLDDLNKLCLWLAQMYQAGNPLRRESLRLSSHLMSDIRVHLASSPSQIPTSHHLHPLRILFSDIQQEALVHWGFIHGFLQAKPLADILAAGSATKLLEESVRGVRLLRELHAQGVYIDVKRLKQAIYTRLLTLYGPRKSEKQYNERARQINPFTFGEMLALIDQAWGEPIFTGPALIEEQVRKGKKLATHGPLYKRVVVKGL